MVKANELRVGNLLNYDTAEGDVVIATIDWQDLQWATEDPKGFNLVHTPIQLTEEWLLKLGFEFWCDELGIKAFYKIYGIEYLCYATNGFWQIRSGLKTHDACWRMHNYPFLKYVHQLQNLYFALTGEELETKGGNNE